jgi:organic hydroperoxide reductase OsmC/OhrA
MSEYRVDLEWQRGEEDFLGKRYSRRHTLRFDGGVEIPASSSATIVPAPLSDPAAVDPEEAFVASLASCHLLTFLAIAAERGFRVDRYRDAPIGTLARNEFGRYVMSQVVLRPEVMFGGDARPTAEQILAVHEAAHKDCYIANSVTTDVRCEPVLTGG